MMFYEGNELIGFLFFAFLTVLFSGIIALLFVPVKIKPVIGIIFGSGYPKSSDSQSSHISFTWIITIGTIINTEQ
jgi:hypothetical protein